MVVGLVVIAVVAIVTGAAVGVAKRKAEAEAEAADWGGLPPIPLGTIALRLFRAAELLTTRAARPPLWSCSVPPDTKFPRRPSRRPSTTASARPSSASPPGSGGGGGMVRPRSRMLPPALMDLLLRLSNRGRDTSGVSAAESQCRIRWVNTRFRVAASTSKVGGRQVQTAAAAEANHPVDI